MIIQWECAIRDINFLLQNDNLNIVFCVFIQLKKGKQQKALSTIWKFRDMRHANELKHCVLFFSFMKILLSEIYLWKTSKKDFQKEILLF